MTHQDWNWNDDKTSGMAMIDGTACRVWRGESEGVERWFFRAVSKGKVTLESDTYSASDAVRSVTEHVAKASFLRLIPQIAKELGSEWSVAPKPPGSDARYERTDLIGPHCAKIWISRSRHEGKLHISGGHTDHSAYIDNKRYDESSPDINVSAAKSAKQIAADIKRRLLPDLFALLQKVNERIAAANDYVASTVSNADRLAKAVKGHVQPLGKYATRHDHSKRTVRAPFGVDSDGDKREISFEVMGERIEFPALTVSVDEAAALLALLVKSRGGKAGK